MEPPLAAAATCERRGTLAAPATSARNAPCASTSSSDIACSSAVRLTTCTAPHGTLLTACRPFVEGYKYASKVWALSIVQRPRANPNRITQINVRPHTVVYRPHLISLRYELRLQALHHTRVLLLLLAELRLQLAPHSIRRRRRLPYTTLRVLTLLLEALTRLALLRALACLPQLRQFLGSERHSGTYDEKVANRDTKV
jgi:hypothetical protein